MSWGVIWWEWDLRKKILEITLLTKVHIVKAMVFPVVMYECESWTIKKAECRRIDAFELWYWRRLLRVPWSARRSNQSILKEINPEYSLEGLMLKLKLQYFGHLVRKVPDAGKDWEQEEKRMIDNEMVGWHHWINGHEFEQTLGDSEGQGRLVCCSSWGHQESDTTCDWTIIVILEMVHRMNWTGRSQEVRVEVRRLVLLTSFPHYQGTGEGLYGGGKLQGYTCVWRVIEGSSGWPWFHNLLVIVRLYPVSQNDWKWCRVLKWQKTVYQTNMDRDRL